MKSTAAAEKEFRHIPIEKLRPSKSNPRTLVELSKLAELEASIHEKGILVPLIVRKLAGDGKYEVVAGQRRYEAAKRVGLAAVPAIVKELDDTAALEVAIIENLQREDVTPLDEAKAFQRLNVKAKLDAATIAARVGQSERYVRDRIRLVALVPEAQALLAKATIGVEHAIVLSRLKPADQRRAIEDGLLENEHPLFDPTVKGRVQPSFKAVTVRELEAWVAKFVRFEPAGDVVVDLFPETAAKVAAAKGEKLKAIPLTHDLFVHPEAKTKDGERTYGPKSWKRADGQRGSKACEYTTLGYIAVGAGRGESFGVCIAKKKCATHWGAELRASKKRAKLEAGGQKTKAMLAYEKERRASDERHKRERAAEQRFKRALPAILAALAPKIAKASTRVGGALVAGLVASMNVKLTMEQAKLVPIGKSSDDVVRHLAWLAIVSDASSWDASKTLPKIAKTFGVDVDAIVKETPEEETKAKDEKGDD